jgi:hypothetical protein
MQSLLHRRGITREQKKRQLPWHTPAQNHKSSSESTKSHRKEESIDKG